MLTILTTTNHYQQITTSIASIERLDELVAVNLDTSNNVSHKFLSIKDNSIKVPIDWYDYEPPYIFPDIELSEHNLMALVFYKLENHQRAFDFVTSNSDLHQHLLIATHLQFGYEISKKQLVFLEQTSKHNLAIAYNFGVLSQKVSQQEIQNTYEEALKNGNSKDLKVFSAKHYANFLIDNSLSSDAESLIRSISQFSHSEVEINAMNHVLSVTLMEQLSLPYVSEKLEEIAHLQQQCITYYESKEEYVIAGLILINASEIANYQEEFVKSNDLINKAIRYFKKENISEFLGEATLQKATLLYTWSKNGSPQYYKPAINTFQNVLKVFKRDTHPQKFADIHHHLALIYSEIQVSEKEKAIWAAFCASSFKEALQFYNKEQFPYQYAMIVHNYATALMGFPEAKLHNNLDKAFGLFEDALSIRTEETYPLERALTLLNQLELYWLIHNDNAEKETQNYKEMLTKANEILTLVDDKNLVSKAKLYLEELKKLKAIIE